MQKSECLKEVATRWKSTVHLHIVINNKNRNNDLSIRTGNWSKNIRDKTQLKNRADFALIAPYKSTFLLFWKNLLNPIQIHSFIQYSVWRQVQSLLQNDAST